MTEPEQTLATELPETIVRRVEDRLQYTEFDSVDEYITFVLEEVLHRVEEADANDGGQVVDEAEVEERLKSLGYLGD